jgi:hypothetical protein
MPPAAWCLSPFPSTAPKAISEACCADAGQTADVHAFIRSVAPQSLEIRATVQIRPIIAAARQLGPIRASPERLHRPLMGIAHPHALAALHIPPAQPAVSAAADQQFLARTPCDCRDHPRMLRKGIHTRRAVHPTQTARRLRCRSHPKPVAFQPGSRPHARSCCIAPLQRGKVYCCILAAPVEFGDACDLCSVRAYILCATASDYRC